MNCKALYKSENYKIKDLEINPENSKMHPREQIEDLKVSIKTFGFVGSIGIDENNIVVDGNGRLQALKELGYEEVSCIKLDFKNEAHRRLYATLMNAICLKTGFEPNQLLIDKEIMLDDAEINLKIQELHLDNFLNFEDKIEELKNEIENKKNFEENKIENRESLNQEINIDNIDTSECKIIFKFDALMYESILNKFNKIKQENNFKTNELVLLKLLKNYGA